MVSLSRVESIFVCEKYPIISLLNSCWSAFNHFWFSITTNIDNNACVNKHKGLWDLKWCVLDFRVAIVLLCGRFLPFRSLPYIQLIPRKMVQTLHIQWITHANSCHRDNTSVIPLSIEFPYFRYSRFFSRSLVHYQIEATMHLANLMYLINPFWFRFQIFNIILSISVQFAKSILSSGIGGHDVFP